MEVTLEEQKGMKPASVVIHSYSFPPSIPPSLSVSLSLSPSLPPHVYVCVLLSWCHDMSLPPHHNGQEPLKLSTINLPSHQLLWGIYCSNSVCLRLCYLRYQRPMRPHAVMCVCAGSWCSWPWALHWDEDQVEGWHLLLQEPGPAGWKPREQVLRCSVWDAQYHTNTWRSKELGKSRVRKSALKKCFQRKLKV